jgi:hypothetical protein
VVLTLTTVVLTLTTVVLTLIDEMRTGLGIDLDPSPSFEREIKLNVAKKKSKYLVIGDGQACLLAEALVRSGQTAVTAYIPEWRVNSGNVGLLCEKAKIAIEESKPETVILIGLEESFFMAQQETGHTLPAWKANDGAFHVDGDLVVAGKEVQMKLLKLMAPIWEITTGRKLVVLSPMIRYIKASCCDDKDHIPNRNLPNFKSMIQSGLDRVKETAKVFLHSGGHHHVRVMDTAIDMAGMKEEEIWGESPTIPAKALF